MTAAQRVWLHSVPPEPEAPVDITALLRAEIRARDWSRCHIAADRRGPIDIADAPKRTWFR